MTVGMMDPLLIPEELENALRDNKIDFVAMTRRLFADPELPEKLAAGKVEDVRPCTNCCNCFHGYCRVNAAYKRAGGDAMPEGYEIQPATTRKKVLVAGGGPAGMEAARVAALRGHEVILYEKSGRLGGLMPMAAVVKGPHEKILSFTNYLLNQLDKLGVKVKLGKEVNLSVVNELGPDVVIVATGGKGRIPDIPGINNRKVVKSDYLHEMLQTGLRFAGPFTLRRLTNFFLPVGRKVIVLGGQIEGVEVAEFLVDRGRDVTIIDEATMEDFNLNMPREPKNRVIFYLQTHGVKILMGVKYGEITDKGLTITTGYGVSKTIEADSIVLALPPMEDTSLADNLQGKVGEIYAVGDCAKAGYIVDAVAAGNLTARKI
jgi:2,4-dienoyl-CoA reductase (NADPH2)